MKKKAFYPIYALFLWGFFVQTPVTGRAQSVPYLAAKDKVFVTFDALRGEKVITHTIEKGQTLYSLARFYGLNEEELYPFNPDLKTTVVQIGQKINVPIPNAAIRRYQTSDFKVWKYAPVYFRVQKGDNMYRLTKTLFRLSADSLKRWNNLKTDALSVGQILRVGWISIDGVPDSIRAGHKNITAEVRNRVLSQDFERQTVTIRQSGAAYWQIKGSTKTDLYCLHRTAKAGSIIAITNTMNQRTVYAKVIGNIPKSAFGSEVVVIVAPSVAKLLGAIDEKFFVKLTYTESK